MLTAKCRIRGGIFLIFRTHVVSGFRDSKRGDAGRRYKNITLKMIRVAQRSKGLVLGKQRLEPCCSLSSAIL